jgi:hypothetical protein
MALRLSALRDVRALLPRKIMVLVSLTDSVNARAILRLEALDKLKKQKTKQLPHCESTVIAFVLLKKCFSYITAPSVPISTDY